MKKILVLFSSIICLFTVASVYADQYVYLAEPNTCAADYGHICREECVQPCKTGNMYMGIFGGANWLDFHRVHGVHPKMKAGYMGSLSLGYKFVGGLRLEAEVAYRKNHLKHKDAYFADTAYVGNAKMGGSTHSWSYMANIVYDFDYLSYYFPNVTPYVGIGCGWSYVHANIKAHDDFNTVHFKAKDNGFAYQAIAGVDYRFNERTSLGVKYYFFEGRKHAQDHSVGVALTQAF